jgi:hypothetical protein
MYAFLVAVVRPAICAALMVVVVRLVLPEYSTAMPTAQAALWLLTGMATGAVAYTVLTVLFWLTVGRPDGAERVVLEKLHVRFARLIEHRRSVAR